MGQKMWTELSLEDADIDEILLKIQTIMTALDTKYITYADDAKLKLILGKEPTTSMFHYSDGSREACMGMRNIDDICRVFWAGYLGVEDHNWARDLLLEKMLDFCGERTILGIVPKVFDTDTRMSQVWDAEVMGACLSSNIDKDITNEWLLPADRIRNFLNDINHT